MSTIIEAASNTKEAKDVLKEKLEQHRKMALDLKDLKKKESDLRDEICEAYKSQGFNTAGTHTFYSDNLEIKMALGISYSLDVDALEKDKDSLSQEERDCIKYTPSIIMDNYNALLGDDLLLDEYIITKDKKPTLKITLSEESK